MKGHDFRVRSLCKVTNGRQYVVQRGTLWPYPRGLGSGTFPNDLQNSSESTTLEQLSTARGAMAENAMTLAAQAEALTALQAAFAAQTARLEALEGIVGTEENPVVNAGDTAWILTSSCLVLMMTIPGLALFYGKPALLRLPLSHFNEPMRCSQVWRRTRGADKTAGLTMIFIGTLFCNLLCVVFRQEDCQASATCSRP